MKIEHFALNVPDPGAMAQWYTQHLGMTIAMALDEAPYTHFLADEDETMLEIYANPAAPMLDFANTHPLVLHLAFYSADPRADAERLLGAGATMADEVNLPDGSLLLMLQDPWGLSLQLCKRGTPLV